MGVQYSVVLPPLVVSSSTWEEREGGRGRPGEGHVRAELKKMRSPRLMCLQQWQWQTSPARPPSLAISHTHPQHTA